MNNLAQLRARAVADAMAETNVADSPQTPPLSIPQPSGSVDTQDSPTQETFKRVMEKTQETTEVQIPPELRLPATTSTTSTTTSTSTPAGNSLRYGAIAVVVLALLAGLGYFSIYKTAVPQQTATQNGNAGAPAKPARPISLSYRLFMKGDRGDPFYASGRGVYHNNDKFKFIVKSTESSHLYIFNEGTNGELI